ncbi:MAG TPA: VOC family protein [Gaiellales bacterium]
MELDHVLVAVPDLAAGVRAIEAALGLTSVEGGRHPGWGTANRIVPLGSAYLELVAVVDAGEAAAHTFGRWLAATQPAGGPFGWAVRTEEIDRVAERLGLPVRDGSRATSDGRLLRWRTAGLEQAAAEPFLPFYIEWAAGTRLPGRAAVTHPAGALEITEVALVGDADRLAAWLGGQRLPVTVRPGASSLERVALSGPAGRLLLP